MMTYNDPEGDDLIRRAERAGGEEFLTQGERWRLANVLDARRRHEAKAARHDGRTDALSSQVLERRFGVLEKQQALAKYMFDVAIPEVLAEAAHETEQRSGAETKKLLAELRDELNAKADAMFVGFERAVVQLRDEDRRVLFENLRETLEAAEIRIDSSLARALEAEKERNTLELALCRDELMTAISEKKYGVLADDSGKHELAERAIAGLRRQVEAIEGQSAKHGSVIDELGQVREGLETFETEHRKVVKSLTLRCAANALVAKKERARATELERKVEHLTAEFERLVGVLVNAKVIT